jgi:uncharacterized protein
MRPLEAPPRLAAQQCAFAAHLRDPQQAAAPDGIEERRLAVYRTLFYNNIENLLASNFPVLRGLRGLRGDAAWHALVRDFYREHRCHSPLFPEIGREFLRYLETRAAQASDDPPFLLELAHYEWVELALALDDGGPNAEPHDPQGDLLAGVPLVSPLAWPLAYRFPVQRIRADFQPTAAPPQPTFLLLVRGRDDAVRFKEIDLLGFRLLQALADNPAGRSGRDILAALAAEAGVADPAGFIANGGRLLEQLREREAILGTRIRATERATPSPPRPSP